MALFLLLVKSIVVFIFGIYCIKQLIVYISWQANRNKNSPRITFKEFEAFYQISPNKWNLRDSYVQYKQVRTKPYYDWDWVCVEFKHYWDVKKYKKWVRKKEKDKIIRDMAATQKAIYEDIQKDIERMMENEAEEKKKCSMYF